MRYGGKIRRERRPVVRRVVLDHQRQIEISAPLLGQREADQSAAVRGHEVDRLRRHTIGRQAEVTFVLTIFIVDDDDELSVAVEIGGFLY